MARMAAFFMKFMVVRLWKSTSLCLGTTCDSIEASSWPTMQHSCG